MKKIQKIMTLVVSLVMLFVFSAISTEVEAATTVALEKSKLTMYVGETIALKQTGTATSVSWWSSKTSVAIVGKTGNVKAKKAGTATIVVRSGDEKARCTVTVKEKKVRLNTTSLTMYEGASYKLKQMGTAKSVKWSTSKSSVASVSSNGTVKALKPGSATITLKSGSTKATCKITVKKKLTSRQVLNKLNAQTTKATNITAKSYVGAIKKENLFMSVGENLKTGEMFWGIGNPEDDGMVIYIKDKKIYWQDQETKAWYYTDDTEDDGFTATLTDSEELVFKPESFKLLSNKTFNNIKCAALQMVIDGSKEIYYFDLVDYRLVGAESGDDDMKWYNLFDLKTTVKVPSTAIKTATYKESIYAE